MGRSVVRQVVPDVSKKCIVSTFMVLQYLPAAPGNTRHPFSSKQTRLHY